MTHLNQNIEVGQKVSFSTHSDVEPATVVNRTAKTVLVRQDKGTLLNGANSGEEDAMSCEVGGFAAHFEGTQRWHIEDDVDGKLIKFSWREKQEKWVRSGSNPRMSGNTLLEGWQKHYDFNF